MPLTEKNIKALNQLSMPDQLDIMLTCADNLGAMSVNEFGRAFDLERRDAYRKSKSR